MSEVLSRSWQNSNHCKATAAAQKYLGEGPGHTQPHPPHFGKNKIAYGRKPTGQAKN